jgi:hypothetical protein
MCALRHNDIITASVELTISILSFFPKIVYFLKSNSHNNLYLSNPLAELECTEG